MKRRGRVFGRRFTRAWPALWLASIWWAPAAAERPWSTSALPQAAAGASDTTTFVVLGHLRGDRDLGLHYLIDEVVRAIQDIDPAFVVLTGDLIWGEPRVESPDSAGIEAQWNRLDTALAPLGMPIYRVAGNHDVSDPVTDRIFERRYGRLPRVVEDAGVRLLLLDSTWPDPATRRRASRGFELDSAQVRMTREVARDSTPTFAFLHHLLWWEPPGSAWWEEVHPALVDAGVRAVFSGDYGPLKFSHALRDGVHYFQSAVSPDPDLGILQGHEWNRLLAGQFDNFIVVRSHAEGWEHEVRTIGAVTSGHFTPGRWLDVHGTTVRPPPPSGRDHLSALWSIPRGKLFVLGSLAAAMAAGLVLGGLLVRARSRHR